MNCKIDTTPDFARDLKQLAKRYPSMKDDYRDFHRVTARERYELLLRRCPGIVHHLALQDLASFLCVTPNYLSTIRKDITFEAKK